jgi:hypothetical protein
MLLLLALVLHMLQDIHSHLKQHPFMHYGRPARLLKVVEVVVVLVLLLIFFHLLKLLQAQIQLQSIRLLFMVQLLQTMVLD